MNDYLKLSKLLNVIINNEVSILKYFYLLKVFQIEDVLCV